MKYKFANNNIPMTPLMLKVVNPKDYEEYFLSMRYANFITKVDELNEETCIIEFSDGEVLEVYADIKKLHLILQGFSHEIIKQN